MKIRIIILDGLNQFTDLDFYGEFLLDFSY